MKNLFFALIAILMVSSSAIAETNPIQNNIVNSLDKVKLTLDLGDITNSTEAEINNRVNNFLINNLSSIDDSLDCSVTVTATVDIGVASFEISVTVSGTCEEVEASGSQIANSVINNIKEELKKYF